MSLKALVALIQFELSRTEPNRTKAKKNDEVNRCEIQWNVPEDAHSIFVSKREQISR